MAGLLQSVHWSLIVVQARDEDEESESTAGASAPVSARVPRSGVAPGFLAPAARTGRGGHAFFVGGNAAPPPRRFRTARSPSGTSPGGHMFFVDIADGPKKPPPKPPQPGFMRSAERRLRMHGQHANPPPPPAMSATSSSVTPTAESSADSAPRSLGGFSSSGSVPRRAPVTTPVLRPWQRHARAMHADAAAAQHRGRQSASAVLTVSPSVAGAAEPGLDSAGERAESVLGGVDGDTGASARHASVDLGMTLSPSAFQQEMRRAAASVALTPAQVDPAAVEAQHNTAQRETAQRESAQRQVGQRESAQPAPAQQRASQRGTAQRETAQRESAKRATRQQGTAESAPARQRAAQRETAQHEAAQGKSPPRETAQRQMAPRQEEQRETSQLETAPEQDEQHEAPQPAAAAPARAKPEAAQREAAQPAAAAHARAIPEKARPEGAQRETAEVNIAQRGMALPQTQQRETARPAPEQQRAGQREITERETAQLDLAPRQPQQRGTAEAAREQQKTAQHESSLRATAKHDSGKRETAIQDVVLRTLEHRAPVPLHAEPQEGRLSIPPSVDDSARPNALAGSEQKQPLLQSSFSDADVVVADMGGGTGGGKGGRADMRFAGREELPGLGQGMDETARMLAELVAEHEGSLMDTAHSEGGPAAGDGDANGWTPAARNRGDARADTAGVEVTSRPELRVVTGAPAQTHAAPDGGLSGEWGRDADTAPDMAATRNLREGAAADAGMAEARRGRSRSPRMRALQPEAPHGPDLEELMAGLRAQLASLPVSPRSAAERRRDASHSASPTRLADPSRSPRTGTPPHAPPSSRSVPASPRAASPPPPAANLSTQRSAHSTSPRHSRMPSTAKRSPPPPHRAASSKSPAHPPEAAQRRSSTERVARSSARTTQRDASHSPLPSVRAGRESLASAPAAPDLRDSRHGTEDASLRHMHEHPQKPSDAPIRPHAADSPPAHGASLSAWELNGLRAQDSPSLSLSSAGTQSVSLSRDSLIAAEDHRGADSADAPFARSVLRMSSVLRDSVAMPAVPEDSALDGPVQSPVREFLARSSAGGAHFGSAGRRDARRTALYAPRPAARSDSETTVVSTDRWSLSAGGQVGRPRPEPSAVQSHGSTSVVNSSEFHSTRGGPARDAGPPIASRSSGRAPFDVGIAAAPAGGPYVADADSETTHGSGWTASAGAALRSPRRGVLDSDDSSICLPAPTLRPSSPRGITALVSTSSISSDAANPISTPKKKQRCGSPTLPAGPAVECRSAQQPLP